MGFFDFLFGGSANNGGNQDVNSQYRDASEMWCSRCKRCDVMPNGDGYYCKGEGGGYPYNYEHQEQNSTGSTIIGYTPNDINRPCCEGEYFIPDNQYDIYRVKYYDYLTKPETY